MFRTRAASRGGRWPLSFMVLRFISLLPKVQPNQDSSKAKYRTLRIPTKKGPMNGLKTKGHPVTIAARKKGMRIIPAMMSVAMPTMMLSMMKAISRLIQWSWSCESRPICSKPVDKLLHKRFLVGVDTIYRFSLLLG